MSMTDPISDLLTRIRNAQLAAHDSVSVPHSKLKLEIVKILEKEGYLLGHSLEKEGLFPRIRIVLKYGSDRAPALQKLERVSKPGRRVYVGKDDIPSVLGGLGINILSTSQGILSGRSARAAGVGGELLCQFY